MAQVESLLAANFVVHLLEDKLRHTSRPPAQMSVAEIVQFYRDTIDLLEERVSPDQFAARYGIE